MRTTVIAFVVCSSLVLAACGGDDEPAAAAPPAGGAAGASGGALAGAGGAASSGAGGASGGAGLGGAGGTGGSGSAGKAGASGSAGGAGGASPGGALSSRQYEPVVLPGAQVPGLAKVKAGDVVAFAFTGGWKQVRVQVDERLLTSFCKVYGQGQVTGKIGCGTALPIQTLFYADDGTFTGADPDPNVDADDELALMARDGGERATAQPEPAGVVPGSGVEVRLTDGAETAYVYLFARQPGGSLEPGAGQPPLVDYDFVLSDPKKAGAPVDYKTGYPLTGAGNCAGGVCDPPILETSTITTGRYKRGFAARWVTDTLSLTTQGSDAADVLDLAQDRFSPDLCGRHVLTFSVAEGAFVTNKSGPVRAIRSYLGANSGPLTERTHLFYESSEQVLTFLRVHSIPSVMDLVDFAPTATGMTYASAANPAGFAVDGVTSPAEAAYSTQPFTWDVVTGGHGSILSTYRALFSQKFTVEGWYEDAAKSPNDQCSQSTTIAAPDADAFGTSGLWVKPVDPAAPSALLPVTDPARAGTDFMILDRTMHYGDASVKVSDAPALAARPAIVVTTTPFAAVGAPSCGDSACATGEACPLDCAPRLGVGATGASHDGYCDLWENSVNSQDCGPAITFEVCNVGACSPDQNELSCVNGCWDPKYNGLSTCLQSGCTQLYQACLSEDECAAQFACVVPCVAKDGLAAKAACEASCAAAHGTPQADVTLASDLLSCGLAAKCK